MSFLLNPENAKLAFETFVLPGIEQAMRVEAVNKPMLYILSLDPTVPYTVGNTIDDLPILFEHSIGRDGWGDKGFDVNAKHKALITWRTGFPSRVVVNTMPHLLVAGDFRHSGSAIYNGIITAASAVQGHYDELFSGMTSMTLSAIATDMFERFRSDKGADNFLPT